LKRTVLGHENGEIFYSFQFAALEKRDYLLLREQERERGREIEEERGRERKREEERGRERKREEEREREVIERVRWVDAKVK
jgi:hypothetical protein